MTATEFDVRRPFGEHHEIFSLRALSVAGYDIAHLPMTVKIFIENLLRHQDHPAVSADIIRRMCVWQPSTSPLKEEFPFFPSRVLLQDFTGVPAVADLAAMRHAVVEAGGDPELIDPAIPVDLVVDHSVQVDAFGTAQAYGFNIEREYERNHERYAFLRWAQQNFKNFRVVPPGMGIVHQVNIEYLASVVYGARSGERLLYPDTLLGTDSHTPMVNGIGVLGWGVGGIEAEAAMLGQPMFLLPPTVVGVKFTNNLPVGTTATDLVLVLTELLRKHGVVNKFVEFCGDGLSSISAQDRATLSNMAPEYGATASYFPVDSRTLEYLRVTGRSPEHIALVEQYTREQDLFRSDDSPLPVFNEFVELDLSTVVPSIAGPRRPQDRVTLDHAKESFNESFGNGTSLSRIRELHSGAVAIAAITSCTNTSNPSVMLGAGLLAKKAVERGLTVPSYVKTSLAPGSRVVTDYLDRAGLTQYLNTLGFNLVGYGCTTCIGNSGPLPEEVASEIDEKQFTVAAVLSGNRNFEGRIHPQVKASYLASPLLVVAYALAGTMLIDLTRDPLGHDSDGNPVYLSDIWPTREEISEVLGTSITAELYTTEYGRIFEGDEHWKSLPIPEGALYKWDPSSTYLQEPPFFEHLPIEPTSKKDIEHARPLAVLGDSITTDHISPAGSISPSSPAAIYLREHEVELRDFNTYGSRRGNHHIMVRGTFANIRLRNELSPEKEGGYTHLLPNGTLMTIFEASEQYASTQTPVCIIAGAEYGSGSSRDWAAKGPLLLGVQFVIAKSYERIHRSNLVGMGILPLEFLPGESRETYAIDGSETFTVRGLDSLSPRGTVSIEVTRKDGSTLNFDTRCRLDSTTDVDYFANGGILPYVLRQYFRSLSASAS
ncbi:MAG: aconitate hydratase AcnA [Candidatus Dormibacteria bacterium]